MYSKLQSRVKTPNGLTALFEYITGTRLSPFSVHFISEGACRYV